ncbi:MFS transporter [Pseudonocardia halophobica]|uniref:MFS-type transporter YvkA n=1 Tax=Pseudonocardia halophobica TaxID=29401 RepID=A0A9W6L2T9_9PSEU|nr:MFS transporter [Pseudonocardia halophobica]GLL12677.1 putative MFS-type transporter YvkA [Pseudonocardia halophobica]
MADPRARRSLGAALLASSLLPLNSTMIAVALPDIAREFARPPGTVAQAVVASYLVAAIVLQSPGGKLGDRLGHRRVLALGEVLMAAGAVLGMVAGSLGVLAVARVLMAAGGAAVVPTTVALLRIELPPERRGRAFGLFGAIMSLAAGVGPVVGGELVRAFGWASIFAVNLPVLAIVALLAATRRRREADLRDGSRFDVLGSVLLTVTLAALVLGLEASGTLAAVLLATCAVLLVPFVWWERRAADPVVAFGLFRSVPFTAGSLLVALQNLVTYTLLFELPQMLGALLAVDSAGTGRLLVAMTATVILASLVAGRLTDIVGPRPMAVGGVVVCLAGVGLLAAGDLSSLRQLVLPLALLGLGVGLATPAAQAASLTAVAREHSGAAAGIGSTMRYLGGVVGVAVLGRLVDLTGDRSVVLGQHRSVLTVFAVALVVSLACAAALPGRSAARKPARTPNGR